MNFPPHREDGVKGLVIYCVFCIVQGAVCGLIGACLTLFILAGGGDAV
jgi:hypothetical protein